MPAIVGLFGSLLGGLFKNIDVWELVKAGKRIIILIAIIAMVYETTKFFFDMVFNLVNQLQVVFNTINTEMSSSRGGADCFWYIAEALGVLDVFQSFIVFAVSLLSAWIIFYIDYSIAKIGYVILVLRLNFFK